MALGREQFIIKKLDIDEKRFRIICIAIYIIKTNLLLCERVTIIFPLGIFQSRIFSRFFCSCLIFLLFLKLGLKLLLLTLCQF